MTTPTDLRHGERGAIMVLGLLGCILLLGVVWTVMSVGESIAFHERAQTGADAVAFSTSVIQARGMNVVVLFNLLMAAILVIRVVLRSIQVAAVIAGFFTLGAGEELAVAIQQILNAVDIPIGAALDGLGLAGQGIVDLNSSFAEGTANYVAKNYTPVVSSVLVTSYAATPGEEGIAPLPVHPDEWGGPLCAKAVATVGDVIDALLQPIGIDGLVHPILGVLLAPMEMFASLLPMVFCEMSVNVTLPHDAVDSALENSAKQCRDNVAKGGTKPGTDDYKEAMKRCDLSANGYDTAKNTAFNLVMGILGKKFGLAAPPSVSVADGWKNGDGQTVTIATLDPTVLKGGMTLFGESAATAAPGAASKALSQSEYYYDCAGKWADADCNGVKIPLGPAEAMWNFRWRARLVPVLPQEPVIQALVGSATGDYQSALSRGGNAQAVQLYQSFKDYLDH